MHRGDAFIFGNVTGHGFDGPVQPTAGLRLFLDIDEADVHQSNTEQDGAGLGKAEEDLVFNAYPGFLGCKRCREPAVIEPGVLVKVK